MNIAVKRDFPDVFYARRSSSAMISALTLYPNYLADTIVDSIIDQPMG